MGLSSGINSSNPALPDLPLRCLKTADETSTIKVVKGRNTVIDFWTTKCTRCPDALDKLDQMAKDPLYANVQFLSICCDKCDGAREIIERDQELKWQNIAHYFMEPDDKETAKQILGFKSVPFYVVLNDQGEIVQLGGSKKIDFDTIPGRIVIEDKENEKTDSNQPALEEVFALAMDDLDF